MKGKWLLFFVERNFKLKSISFHINLICHWRLYSTLARAWENVDMAGSRPYMWNDCGQGKGTLAGIRDLWSVPTAWSFWGKWDLHLTWTPNTHKRGIMILFVRGCEILPSHWLCLCWTTVGDMCIALKPLDVPFLVQGLPLM